MHSLQVVQLLGLATEAVSIKYSQNVALNYTYRFHRCPLCQIPPLDTISLITEHLFQLQGSLQTECLAGVYKMLCTLATILHVSFLFLFHKSFQFLTLIPALTLLLRYRREVVLLLLRSITGCPKESIKDQLRICWHYYTIAHHHEFHSISREHFYPFQCIFCAV